MKKIALTFFTTFLFTASVYANPIEDLHSFFGAIAEGNKQKVEQLFSDRVTRNLDKTHM